tara:strand:- start:114 stop:497 length:384 start_codon:yes stop_codon:yes gene_type:complete
MQESSAHGNHKKAANGISRMLTKIEALEIATCQPRISTIDAVLSITCTMSKRDSFVDVWQNPINKYTMLNESHNPGLSTALGSKSNTSHKAKVIMLYGESFSANIRAHKYTLSMMDALTTGSPQFVI